MNKKIWSSALLLLIFVFLPQALDASVLTVRLYGGGTYIQGGDLNGGMKGWTDYWKANYRIQGYPGQTGSFSPIHLGYNAGGDIIFQFSPRFGVGLGTEYLMAEKSADLVFVSPSENIDWNIVGRASAIPLKLSLFYFLPLGDRISLSLHAGVGYYSANARMESNLKTSIETSYLIDSSAKGAGYHAGFGLELKLFPKVFFLIEGAGRYVVLSGFEGNVTMLPEGGWKGKLYYWGASKSFIDRYDYIDLLAGAPNSTGYIFFREAKIDYSGFSLRAGFVIRL